MAELRSWVSTAILGEVGQDVVGIVESARRRLIKTIDQGIAEGMGAAELGRLIEESSTFSPYRAEVIARTETNRVLNISQLETMRGAGINQVEAVDGDLDAECAARNGQVYPLDTAMGIRDHPNGTLDWIPVALGIDTRNTGPAPTTPPVTPVVALPPLKRKPPKPKPAAKRAKDADPLAGIKTVDMLDGYLTKTHGTRVRAGIGQAELWTAEQLREIALSFDETVKRTRLPKGAVRDVELPKRQREGVAGDMDMKNGYMRLFPSLRQASAKGETWGITKDFGAKSQLVKTTTHEIGHRAQELNKDAARKWQKVWKERVRIGNPEALEKQLAQARRALEFSEEAVRDFPEGGWDEQVVITRKHVAKLEKELEKAKQANVEQPMSEYGRSNYKEDWADGFYAYVWHPERMREKWPRRYAIMEEAFG